MAVNFTHFRLYPGLSGTCVICCDSIDKSKQIPVGHMVSTAQSVHHLFHRDCISQWFKMKASCPICAAEVKNAHHFVSSLMDLSDQGKVNDAAQERKDEVGVYLKIQRAIFSNDVEIIRQSLEKDLISNYYRGKALCLAAGLGNLDIVRLLSKENIWDQHGRKLINEAFEDIDGIGFKILDIFLHNVYEPDRFESMLADAAHRVGRSDIIRHLSLNEFILLPNDPLNEDGIEKSMQRAIDENDIARVKRLICISGNGLKDFYLKIAIDAAKRRGRQDVIDELQPRKKMCCVQ